MQTGDPLGPDSSESDGGSAIWGLINGPTSSSSKKTFPVTIDPKQKHTDLGTVSMATVPSATDPDTRLVASQFLITLSDTTDTTHLDGRAAIFGKVVEGFDALSKINEAFTDSRGRPLQDIRIRHTVVLDDPYPDPPGLSPLIPATSPQPSKSQLATVLIADDEPLSSNLTETDLEKLRREREARAQALTLEILGDLPLAEISPPENVLFVCKLNPVTASEDLELIFSRFGTILSCEVIRDKRTGDSLQYAFIEYSQRECAEQAYFKMQGVLIDDHRIHVDFSQSVSKLGDSWRENAGKKRRQRGNGGGGGWGGIESLEKKRHYRDDRRDRDDDDGDDDGNNDGAGRKDNQRHRQQGHRNRRDMVFDRDDIKNGASRRDDDDDQKHRGHAYDDNRKNGRGGGGGGGTQRRRSRSRSRSPRYEKDRSSRRYDEGRRQERSYRY